MSLRRQLEALPVGADITLGGASVSRLKEGYSVAILRKGRWEERRAETVDEVLEMLRREGILDEG